MRTITQKVNLYKFDELDKLAQKRVIERAKDDAWNSTDLWLEDMMYDYLLDMLKKVGIKADKDDIQLRYNLGYSQGDGASFIGRIQYQDYDVAIGVNNWGVLYQHWNTIQINEMRHVSTYEPATGEKVKELTDILWDINRKLEKRGYELIEDEVDEKELRLKIQGEDLEYLVTGEQWHGRD